MNYVTSFDTRVFFLINHAPHPAVLDFLAQTLSGLGSGGLIFVVLALFLFFREEGKDHWFLVPFILIFSISAVVSELLLKTRIARIRPEELMGALVVAAQPETYSFPSTHAVLAFAGAALLSWKEPRWGWLWYGLAILIALSRVYLGHHYPIDVVIGALLGYAIAKSVIWITNRFRPGTTAKRRKKT
jgi:undecaprenyl-diphosphatase